MTFHAFRVAEDHGVLLPYMINFDGFILSHVIEPIEYWPQELIDQYIGIYEPMLRLDTKNPITMGPVGIPDIYLETRKAHDFVLRESKATIVKAWDEMEKLVGRRYRPIETYKTDGARILLLTMGGTSETAMTAVDALRETGLPVGLVRLRLWRPFPFEELYEAVKDCEVLGVVDRCLSTGGPGGPVASEIKGALYHKDKRPKVVEFIAGLGGRDIRVEDFQDMAKKTLSVADGAPLPPFELVGVRQ